MTTYAANILLSTDNFVKKFSSFLLIFFFRFFFLICLALCFWLSPLFVLVSHLLLIFYDTVNILYIVHGFVRPATVVSLLAVLRPFTMTSRAWRLKQRVLAMHTLLSMLACALANAGQLALSFTRCLLKWAQLSCPAAAAATGPSIRCQKFLH